MTPPQRLLVLLLRGYQLAVSPWLGPRCRYVPTCSAYALEAIGRHGAAAGSLLAAKRLCRCHPWGGFGLDPVPELPPERDRLGLTHGATPHQPTAAQAAVITTQPPHG